jgi:ppGpp synthetase/RelA/SpoT-type nucleotidyltranferase
MAQEKDRVLFNGIRVMAGWPERVKAAQEITQYEIGGKSYRRVLFGDEPGPTHGDNRFACHDCAVVRGQFHVPGCDVEACPVCGGQSIACDCPRDEDAEEESGAFSFEAHKRTAVAAYLVKRDDYEKFCGVVKNIIEQAILRRGIKINTIQARAKDPSSFEKKAAKPSDTNPAEPKYPNPLEDIKDLAGIRVITFSPNGIVEIEKVISQEFKILERSDKGEKLIAEERFGYSSVHYLVKLSDKRESLPEYEKFGNLVAEVQVRTILQHAWAEIEHDIQYKSTSVIPIDIRRRFIALAGVLEFADREFQAVQDEDKRLRQEARQKIREGEIDEVEITPDALKTFMTERFGVDKRILGSHMTISHECCASAVLRIFDKLKCAPKDLMTTR